MKVRLPTYALERLVQRARAQGTSPAALMRATLVRAARQAGAARHRGGQ